MVGKIKYETACVAIKEFVGWKPQLYSYLVDENIEHLKAKDLNKNIAVTTSHEKWKYVFFNRKCLGLSMNRIQSENQRIETFEINNIFLSYFDDKISIQNNVCDGLALGY